MSRMFKIVIAGGIILFSFLAPCHLGAQSRIVDSLDQVLQSHYSAMDSNRVNFLMHVIYYEKSISPENAIQRSREAITLAKRIDHKMGLAYTYYQTGVIFSVHLNDHVNADKYYDSAILIFSGMKTSHSLIGMGHAYNKKGEISRQEDDYKNSLGYYLKALSFYEKSGKTRFQIGSYNNLTNLYRSTQDPEKAFEYAERAFALTGKVTYSGLIDRAYLNYAFELMNLGDFAQAESLISQRKQSIEKAEEHYDRQYFHSYFGRLHFLQGRYDIAEPYFVRGLYYAELTLDKLSICEALVFLIGNQIKQGNLLPARKNIERLMAIARSVKSKYHELNGLESYYQWHKRAGNFSEALVYSEGAAFLRDSLLDSRNKIHMNYAAAKFQTERSEQEIAQLQKDNKIQELLIRNRSILNIVFICISLLLFVLLIGAFFNFRHKQKIAEKDKQFMIMSSLLKGQEKERSRLAKDLHDGIGCILTSVKYSLANVRRTVPPESENYTRIFESSIEVIDTSIRELRRVAYNMMPEALIKFGLDEGLKDFCQYINSSNGMNIQYQSFGLNRMDNDTEIILYRIVQELLTNVVKHSYATETYVQLVKDGSRLSISVEDNGKGFDMEKISTKKSAGWLSLQSRVDFLKGRLEVSSILEKGTTVAMEFNV